MRGWLRPQTLSDEWKEHLGPTWEDDHDQLLHTLGNLTLTGFNSELGNLSFSVKKTRLLDSNVSLNRYFRDVERWTADEIENRAEALVDRALAIWPYFGKLASVPSTAGALDREDVTGTVPRLVRIRDHEVRVQSWVDVEIATIEAIIRIGDEEFEVVAAELPKFVNRDATAFRRSSRLKKLSNGAYIETNLSALAIHRLCVQSIQLAGLRPDEWIVERVDPGDDEGEAEGPEAPSSVRQLQLEFWNETKKSLLATSKWPTLRAARPQYWYDIPLGRAGIHMTATANTMDKRVGVKVTLMPERAERALQLLALQRDAIEMELGFELEWNPHPEKRVKTIKVTKDCNLLDRATWPMAIAWLTATAVAMHRAFAHRVTQLDLGPEHP